MTEEQVAKLREHVANTIGESPRVWPGGYTTESEAALIDAIYSIRARYGSRERKTGVYGAVWRWREHRDFAGNDFRVLASIHRSVRAVGRRGNTEMPF